MTCVGCNCETFTHNPELHLVVCPLHPEHASTPACSNCRFYGDPRLREGTMGRCRRRAPRSAEWPTVAPDDWCGEHESMASVLTFDDPCPQDPDGCHEVNGHTERCWKCGVRRWV